MMIKLGELQSQENELTPKPSPAMSTPKTPQTAQTSKSGTRNTEDPQVSLPKVQSSYFSVSDLHEKKCLCHDQYSTSQLAAQLCRSLMLNLFWLFL